MSTSPINARKLSQGFVGALERKRCATCKHCVECYQSVHQCRVGGFMVSKFAVCDRWELRPPPGFKGPAP